MKRWIAFLPLAGAVLLGVLFFARVHHDPHYIPDALVGKALPAETLPPMAGGAPVRLALDAPPGTVVNFFASWCVPCVQEQPALMALKAQGVKVIGVVSPWRYDSAATQAFLTRGNPYSEILLDPDGKATLDFGVSGVPETFVVGKDGRIAAKYALPLDAQSAEALSEQVDKARHG
jgi:cytochrome c biogenesis protein CcmG/thiol:disulfide interchange protein DsbE